MSQSQINTLNPIVEEIAYHEGCSPEVVRMIKSRVAFFTHSILILNELPVPSPYSVNLMFDQCCLLTKDIDSFALLVNLRNAARPDARIRMVINNRFKELTGRMYHCAFYTGRNPIINTAIRFVMFGSALESFSVSSSKADALQKIKDAQFKR